MLRDKSLIHKRGRCRKFGNHSLSGHCLTLNMPHVNPALGYFLVDSVNTAKGNGFIMICWIWFSFDDCLCHHMVLTNGIHKDERQTERKQTFFFFYSSCFSNNNSTLCKRSILCRTSLLRGERKEGNRHYVLSPVIHFCPVPSASHPSLCGWQVFSDETKTPPTCSVLLPSTKLTKKNPSCHQELFWIPSSWVFRGSAFMTRLFTHVIIAAASLWVKLT